MEKLRINKNSWHYKIVSYVSWERKLSCDYFAELLLSPITLIGTFIEKLLRPFFSTEALLFGYAFATWLWLTFFCTILGLWFPIAVDIALGFIIIGLIVITFFLALILLTLISIGIVLLWEWIFPEKDWDEKTKEPKIKPPSFTKTLYKSLKDKYCVPIEYIDGPK